MTLRDDLIAARALIEKGWTQERFAKDVDGNCVPILSQEAVCFCISGAIWKAAAEHARAEAAEDSLRPFLPGGYIVPWNDAPGRTQAEVLSLFDRAIEAAQP